MGDYSVTLEADRCSLLEKVQLLAFTFYAFSVTSSHLWHANTAYHTGIRCDKRRVRVHLFAIIRETNWGTQGKGKKGERVLGEAWRGAQGRGTPWHQEGR